MQAILERFRNTLFIYPGYHIAPNHQCHLYNGHPRRDGYKTVTFTDPYTHSKKSMSIQRMAWTLIVGEYLDNALHVSHRCHNKLCINYVHLSVEPQRVNNSRLACVKRRRCSGHGRYSRCLLHLKL